MAQYDPLDKSSADQNDENEDTGEDFATLLESDEFQKDIFIPQDSKVEGTIVSIGEEWVFVDIGGKSEGTISREELLDENGKLSFNVGDPLTAYVVNNREGEILLSVKMTAAASEEAIRGAHRSGVPVEGLVVAERKGGYSVMVLGKSAFCPYSQMDLQPTGDTSGYIAKRFSFRITEYSERGRNIVLSRREILEEERLKTIAQLKDKLKPGEVISGTVRNLAQFGAFVDIGGVEGLIPMSELAWHRVAAASDVLSPGDSVTVRILDLDWKNMRISLSLKQTLDDPWDSVTQQYQEHMSFTGTVMKLMNFGAFIQLEPGIEGLIHISNLGKGRRINHPREVLSEGDQVEVRIISVYRESRRIGLELISPGFGDEGSPEVELKQGDVVAGTVDSIKEYGVFVRLPGGKSGLMHLSEIGTGGSGDLRNRFPLGSSVDVQILAIEPETGKISLSTKSLGRRTEESHFKEFNSGSGSRTSLGTFGDLFQSRMKS
jgi:small subunit ribosomal protein S1